MSGSRFFLITKLKIGFGTGRFFSEILRIVQCNEMYNEYNSYLLVI